MAVYKHVDPAIVHSCAQHCTGADGVRAWLHVCLQSGDCTCQSVPVQRDSVTKPGSAVSCLVLMQMAVRQLAADLESSHAECIATSGLACAQVSSAAQAAMVPGADISCPQQSRPQQRTHSCDVLGPDVAGHSPHVSSRSSPLADPRSHPIVLAQESSADGPLAVSASLPRSAQMPHSEHQSVEHTTSSKVRNSLSSVQECTDPIHPWDTY